MYIPSVNIEYQKSDDLHYLITPNARAVLGTMIERFQAGVHSFQIIGSYGTGKSSFLLALQRNLQTDSSDLIQNKRVFNGFDKFEFCNIVGDYNSMANVLGKKLSLATQGSDNVLSAMDVYYTKAQKEGKFLFVFVDEFGKILEHAAGNPEEELYFIQKLTEYVNAPQQNMILVTVLHQSFSAYAQKLSEPQRNADAVFAIRVIPPRIHEHAVVVDGRIPFGGLEIAHRHDVRAVVLHGEERVVAHFDVGVEAADVAAAPFGDECQTAVRQPAWVEIVVCFVRQHAQVGAIDIDREDMPAGVAGEDIELVVAVGRPREGDPLAVVGQIRRAERAEIQFAAFETTILHNGIL